MAAPEEAAAAPWAPAVLQASRDLEASRSSLNHAADACRAFFGNEDAMLAARADIQKVLVQGWDPVRRAAYNAQLPERKDDESNDLADARAAKLNAQKYLSKLWGKLFKRCWESSSAAATKTAESSP